MKGIQNQRVMDREAMRRSDAKEGRVRLYTSEREDLIYYLSARQIVMHTRKGLERLCRLRGKTWWMLCAVEGMMTRIAREIMSTVSYEQQQSIVNNSSHVTISIKAHEQTPGALLVEEDPMYSIATAARCGACSGSCMMSLDRSEWQKCELRKALDKLPTREGKYEKQQYSEGICPFAMSEEEANDLRKLLRE